MKNKDYVLEKLKSIIDDLNKENLSKDDLNLCVEDLEEVFIFIEDNL